MVQYAVLVAGVYPVTPRVRDHDAGTATRLVLVPACPMRGLPGVYNWRYTLRPDASYILLEPGAREPDVFRVTYTYMTPTDTMPFREPPSFVTTPADRSWQRGNA